MMLETTGKIDFRVGNETYQTWYKSSVTSTLGVRPLIVLHGGLGLSHHYVLPFKELNTRFNIPVIFCDRIGIGESSHPKNVPKGFWALDLFMDELDNVLQYLGISANFDLAGHSWGGMLAQAPTWTATLSPCERRAIHASVGREHSSTSGEAACGAEREIGET
ncbi:Alpha/Beta hydrolase protein [Butyriboletus roseoflavus]|nr:Alpha/Beta hydrolase protein [Butyriboletus roseoflavus]